MPTELTFVSAEEAAKWPEGTDIIIGMSLDGPQDAFGCISRSRLEYAIEDGWERFARLPMKLPESLPELEKNNDR